MQVFPVSVLRCSHLGWTLNLPRGPGSHVDQGLEHSTARDSNNVMMGLFSGDWSTHKW